MPQASICLGISAEIKGRIGVLGDSLARCGEEGVPRVLSVQDTD